MSDAWASLVNSGASDEHLELCNAALIEVQKAEQARTLRLVANTLSVMAGNGVSAMDAVDVLMRARDRVMEPESRGSVAQALDEAQKAL